MGRKKRVHTIDSSSLAEPEDGNTVSLPSEKLVSMKVPCTVHGLTGGLAGGAFGYLFGLWNWELFRKPSLLRFHKTGMEAGRSLGFYGGVFSLAMCFSSRIRQKEDIWNGAIAGCTTGFFTSLHEGPVQASRQCLIFGASYAAFELVGKVFFSEAQALSIYEDSELEKCRATSQKKIRRSFKLTPSFECRRCQTPLWFVNDLCKRKSQWKLKLPFARQTNEL